MTHVFEINRGVYALVGHLVSDHTIRIGKLGNCNVGKGYYAYIGSASGPGGLSARIKHHLRRTDRPHWHIDYLKPVSKIKEVWYSNSNRAMEHQWAAVVAKMPGARMPIKGFGSSDCGCVSHLYCFLRKPNFRLFIKNLKKSGCMDHVGTVSDF
jgi:Uri superfamily endonuclease